jgi:hypothetical protein
VTLLDGDHLAQLAARVTPARAGFPRSLLPRALEWEALPLAQAVQKRAGSFGQRGRITPARAGLTARVLPAVSTSEITTAQRVLVPPALNTEDQRTELLPFARVLRHERRDVLQGIGSAPLARANRYSDPGEKGP